MHMPERNRLAKIWAEVPADYYFHLNYFQKLWHEWKWLVIKHLLKKDGRSPGKILEIGCSGGHLTVLVGELFPDAEVTGVDVYAPAIIEAKRRYPKHKFKQADAQKLPYSANSFDIVYSSETIEHVVDPKKMLEEITRVMQPDGLAVIEMDSGSPLFRFIWHFWTNYGKGRVWRDAHLHPFTAKELEGLIRSNGFHIRNKMFSHFGMAVTFLVTKKH